MSDDECKEVISHVRAMMKFKRQAKHLGLREQGGKSMNARLDALLERLEPVTESGCLIYTGKLARGYARIFYNGKPRKLHRVVYEYLRGPIPDGMTIDHLCRVRCCANIHHLEVVTNKENVLRGVGITARNAKKSQCARGHALEGYNLMIVKNGRQCRACKAVTNERYLERREARA